MAGVLNFGKGSQPAQPSSGNCVLYVEGSASSFNNGVVKAFDACGIISILSPNARINFLRNSGFWFAQRQAPGTATTYGNVNARTFSADAWFGSNENASFTYQQIDTSGAIEAGLNGRYYGTFLKITNTGKLAVGQAIEGTEVDALRNRTIRVQLWMKGTASQTVRLGLIQLTSAGTIDSFPATYISAYGGASVDPTLGTNLSYIAPKNTVQMDNCTANGNACDCSVTTAWQRFGGLFDVPSSCKNLIVSVWSNAQLTATNGFSLAQASLTDGFEIQDWSPLNLADEKTRVMRHYQKSFLEATAPAQNVGANTGESKGIAGKATAVANAGFIFHRYQPPLRAAPGVTLFNPQAANALMRDQTAAADMGATSTTGNTQNDLMVNATGVAGTAVGNQVGIHWTADAEL